MNFQSINHIQLLRYAGLYTYVWVCIPWLWNIPEDEGTTAVHLAWVVSYLTFGVAYWAITRDLGKRQPWQLKVPLLVIMTSMTMALSYFSHSGLGSVLMLVIAGVLPWLLPFWPSVVWLILQNFALIPIMKSQPDYGWLDALIQSGVYLGYTGFAFITSLVARQQADSREEFRRLNSELRATRKLLAESSRIAERMRISRELHDLVGHHLTALSLNLEVASHLVSGGAQEHVRQAQSVAKLLLSDVREVVSQLRDGDAIDLTEALRTIVEGVPALAIHLELPPRFAVDDPRRTQVLLRCAQEIITNAVRHADARNLWLRFEHTAEKELAIHARDDGLGADMLKQGNGLVGMRERLAQLGGRLNIITARGQGFTLEAWLPLETTDL